MKRVLAAAAAVLMILMLLPASAAADSGRLYAEYVPRSQRGTVFYLDVCSDSALSAARIELDYPAALAQYRGYSEVGETSYLKLRESDGRLTLLFCDSTGLAGRLFRLRFKAIGSGDAAFTLRMTEGTDADLRRAALPPAFSLSLTLSGRSYAARTSSSLGGSYNGPKSSAPSAAASDTAADTASGTVRPVVRDLSRPPVLSIVIICCSTAAIAALLVTMGFLLGRRSKSKKRPAPAQGEEAQREAVPATGEEPDTTIDNER